MPQLLMNDVLNPDLTKEYITVVKEALYTEDNDEAKKAWKEVYLGVMDLLRKYCDLKEEYYSIISLWIVGTYFHEQFYTYPYLFLNAMKGSGKTRLLKLIKLLSKDGEMLNSLTEAVLFRTRGALCIDEFEGLSRKGGENLRELLNSAYKKGTMVKRMRKVKTMGGESQEVESFDVYRPIAIANIWGMESVLGDRCLTLILERSVVPRITKLVEVFEVDPIYTHIKSIIEGKCSLCSVVMPVEVYKEWNDYITTNYTTTQTNNNTKLHKLLDDSGINGRSLELTLPLILVANYLGEDILIETIQICRELVRLTKEDEFTDNHDVSLIDFISQLPQDNSFYPVKSIAEKFKEFLQSNEEWINSKWMGRALKRLGLVKKKKRYNRGIEIVPDIKKAGVKILMFK